MVNHGWRTTPSAGLVFICNKHSAPSLTPLLGGRSVIPRRNRAPLQAHSKPFQGRSAFLGRTFVRDPATRALRALAAGCQASAEDAVVPAPLVESAVCIRG